jgi:predicted lipoprotein
LASLVASSLLAPLLASLVASLLAVVAMPALAQSVAVPYYGPDAFVAALEARQQAPLAGRFEASAQALVGAMEQLCAGSGEVLSPAAREDADGKPGPLRQAARSAWLAAADDWERLQALSVGATVERRSARSIDFRPARPALIKRSLGLYGRAKEPPDSKALEKVGAPAKGLPAIEWLLWDPAAPQTHPACRYATGLANEVHREAAALAAAHAADAARDWAEESELAANRADEAINQWLAGFEGLRWRNLGKPLAMLADKEGTSAEARQDSWPRPPSASHRSAWKARWETLRATAIGPAPTDGFGPQPAVAPDVISLEAMLRGRGHNREADGWVQAIMTADQAMQALQEEGSAASHSMSREAPGSSTPLPPGLPPLAALEQAAKALDSARQFMQDKVAPGLKVTLGFSDADGD